MGYQIVRMTREVTYGVFPTGTLAAGSQQDIFLPENDAMSVRVEPKMWSIRDAGQGNRKIRMSVGRKDVSGALATYLFPTQTPFFLGLVAGLTGTPPCYRLPSFSIDHLIYDQDCGVKGVRYLGCKFGDGTLACDNSEQGCLTSFKGSILGSTSAALTLPDDFPVPSLSAYPGEDPFQFYHTAENSGLLTVNSARHGYTSLSVGFKNVLKAFMGERRFASRVDWFGRDITLDLNFLYANGSTDRADYEAGTAKAVSVKFDNGTNTALLDFGANVKIASVKDTFPLDGYYMQQVSFEPLVDGTLTPASDFVLTTT